MVNGPQTKLAFQNLQIENALRVEPEFHPDILEYDVYPIAGPADMSFSVVMNTPPTPAGRYPNYSFYFHADGRSERWLPSSEANPTEHKFTFTASPQQQKDITIFCESDFPEVDPTLTLVLHVHSRGLAEGECGHFITLEEEGEIWGGASGSCQIEILTICSDCGQTVKSRIDYHD